MTNEELAELVKNAPKDLVPSNLYWITCEKCELCEDRTFVVIGRGDPQAKVMFVGEGPGPKEDEEGVPFTGPSGDLLNQFLGRIGWPRQTVFVDNIVGCWPHRESTEDPNKMITQKPNTKQMTACLPRLWDAIYQVDPILIVALGRLALKGLTGVDEAISSTRGTLFMASIPGYYKRVTYPVIPTFHPAYLLRKPYVSSKSSMRKVSPMQQCWDDLSYAKELFIKLQETYSGYELSTDENCPNADEVEEEINEFFERESQETGEKVRES